MAQLESPVSILFDSYDVKCTSITLNTSATFSVKVLPKNKKYCLLLQFEMSEQDYKNWANDDQYVYDWVKTKLLALNNEVEE